MFYKNIQGFWGYFVMVLNTIYIKGLSDMSVLYVFAPGPSAAGSGQGIKLYYSSMSSSNVISSLSDSYSPSKSTPTPSHSKLNVSSM